MLITDCIGLKVLNSNSILAGKFLAMKTFLNLDFRLRGYVIGNDNPSPLAE